MEKYNFDFIFAVPDREEQLHRMRHAINGLDKQIKAAEERLAGAFLDDPEASDSARRFQYLEEIEQCQAALLKDPRTIELGKWVTEQNSKKLGSTLSEAIMEMLNRR